MIGAGIGILLGGVGATTAIVNEDEKMRKKQTKEQLEKIVLDLTTREQEEKNNLIKYLTIVKEKMNGLEGELNEARQQLNKAVEEATELKGKFKERNKELEKEKDKEQQEKEEQARLLGETQKALLSAERSEIEQLRAERNQLRATSEEQEAFLSRWIRQYSRLELEKDEAAHLALKYGAEVREYRKDKEILTNQISVTEIERGELRADNERLIAAEKRLTKERNDARSERDTAREELGNLKLEKIQWAYDKKKLEEEKDEAVRTMESLGYPK